MRVNKSVLGTAFHPGPDPMDAIPTQASVTYLDQPPVLLTGSSDAAIERARRTIEASGARLAGPLPLSEAADRIEAHPPFDRVVEL